MFFIFYENRAKIKKKIFQKVRFLQHFPPTILFFMFDFCAIFAVISQKNSPAGHLPKEPDMGNMYNT
jgi:hypothetical protein